MIERTTRRGLGAGPGRGRDIGCCFRPGWWGRHEGAEVAAGALETSGESRLAQSPVELGKIMAPLQPAGVKVGPVLVQDGQPAGGFDQEFVEAGGAGETADGGVVQALSADRHQGLPLGRPIVSMVPSGWKNGTASGLDGSGVTSPFAVVSAMTGAAANAARIQPW